MQIHGLNKTTLLDYPEHVAATIFCGGCNFRCPFCHNSDLVLHPMNQPLLEEQEVLAFLKKRSTVLSGICITGGEPTLQADLADFIRKVKALGYLVKLDTNGYRLEVIKGLVKEKLVDYIAMDIKAGETNYGKAAGISDLEIEKIKESIDFIMHCGVKYEFRTTVVKGIHRRVDFEEISTMIQGCRAYFLQSYKDNENVLVQGFESFSKGEMEAFADIVRPYVEKAELRGIE